MNIKGQIKLRVDAVNTHPWLELFPYSYSCSYSSTYLGSNPNLDFSHDVTFKFNKKEVYSPARFEPPLLLAAVRAKVRYKVNHFVVSVLFNNKIYAPHPETQTTKTDHFPAVNNLFRLPGMYLLPTVEIRIS